MNGMLYSVHGGLRGALTASLAFFIGGKIACALEQSGSVGTTWAQTELTQLVISNFPA
jgi:hypothetical protein